MFFIRELRISGTLDLVNAALFSSAPVPSVFTNLFPQGGPGQQTGLLKFYANCHHVVELKVQGL